MISDLQEPILDKLFVKCIVFFLSDFSIMLLLAQYLKCLNLIVIEKTYTL